MATTRIIADPPLSEAELAELAEPYGSIDAIFVGTGDAWTEARGERFEEPPPGA